MEPLPICDVIFARQNGQCSNEKEKTMKHNFDELIDRRVSECKKYEPSYPKDVIPMWIADTDFAVPEEIAEAIQKRAEHPCFGYPVESFEFERAAARWEKVRFEIGRAHV